MRKTTMLRKTLTILSLIGLLLSVALWLAGYCDLRYYTAAATIEFNEGCLFVSTPGTSTQNAHFWLQHPHVARNSTNSAMIDGSLKTLEQMLEADRSWGFFGHAPIYGHADLQAQWWPKLSKARSHLPLWIPTVAFAIAPISFILLPLHRYSKRKKLGLCLKCGYDMRGSKERCPECGARFEKPKRSADCRA